MLLRHVEQAQRAQCKLCLAFFENQSRREEHEAFHSFPCVTCKVTHTSQQALLEHLSQAHKARCTLCHAVFEDENQLEEHHQDEHECEVCGKIFNSPANKAKHELRDHELEVQEKVVQVSSNLLDCKTCGEHFEEIEDLLNHESVSHVQLSIQAGVKLPPGMEMTLTPTRQEASGNSLLERSKLSEEELAFTLSATVAQPIPPMPAVHDYTAATPRMMNVLLEERGSNTPASLTSETAENDNYMNGDDSLAESQDIGGSGYAALVGSIDEGNGDRYPKQDAEEGTV